MRSSTPNCVRLQRPPGWSTRLSNPLPRPRKRGLARARDDEAITARSYAIKLTEEANLRNDTTDATKKEIQAAQQSADEKRSEADQAKNIETEATKANAEATKDLAGRVFELRGAAQSAFAAVERLVEAQKHGRASADDVAAAEAKTAAATLLYRDALRDATAAAERKVQAEGRNASLAQGAIDVERERALAVRDVAHASADEATASRANEQARGCRRRPHVRSQTLPVARPPRSGTRLPRRRPRRARRVH